MKVSRKTEYALRSVWQLALHPERTATLAEISELTNVPGPFLAKIMQRLAGAGIVVSVRGARGGFRLARPPHETSLYEVYVAMEGNRAARNQCAVSPQVCGTDGYCAVHPFWNSARRKFEQLLKEATAGDTGARNPLPPL